jgi:5'-nucleotidase (lipoprotein e(P4) family)
MNNLYKSLTVALAVSFLSACGTSPYSEPTQPITDSSIQIAVKENLKSTSKSSHLLNVATWNVEHLAYPIDQGCKPRDEDELNAMRAYAQKLDADVVALQEVASKEAVHLLFPEAEWQVVMSARPDSKVYDCRGSGYKSTQQKTAIAIKKALKIAAVEQNEALALNRPGLRFGLGVSLETPVGIVEVLNLHLKSGCFVDDYLKSDSQSCANLSEQAEVLYDWIEQRENASTPYIILGDLNHRISAPYNRMTQSILAKSKNDASPIRIVTQAIIGCHPRYPAPIDHIIVGGLALNGFTFNTLTHNYKDMNEDAMLSDHCATSVDISQARYPLSSAVKWQVSSKEYELITRAIYQQASATLADKKLPSGPWVAVMDLDETVLNNSQYQVNLNTFGQTYSSLTWNDWIKSEQATLVPGAKQFIETVLSQGGKLVFVTNREKKLDAYTWSTMLSLGLPINERNTCLMGRSSADVDAVKKPKYANDKDLRREKVTLGAPDCFSTQGLMPSNWKTAHAVIMQVGDNIEDINDTTQQEANVDSILTRWGDDIVILPNPMYGSWN